MDSFDVSHNPDRLAIRKTYRIRSVKRAEAYLKRFMEQRQPRGLRCRYGFDPIGSWGHFETRTSLAMDTVLMHLRNGGFLVERLPTKEF